MSQADDDAPAMKMFAELKTALRRLLGRTTYCGNCGRWLRMSCGGYDPCRLKNRG
jgi:hypothetical protein